MIRYDEAVSMLVASALRRRVPSEDVALEHSLGRFLACPISSPEAVPPFDNSAMDGFAVASTLTKGARQEGPVRFAVNGCIAAGDAPITRTRPASENIAWEIMTGAPMPSGGFDAVIKIEDVEVKRDASGLATEVLIFKAAEPGENVRERGLDFSEGAAVAAAGTQIQPEHLMALASLGISQVSVVKRPRIAVISTGRELVHHSEKTLSPGMIRNSTAPYLMAALPRLGADCTYYGAIPDNPRQFISLLTSVLSEKPDVVLTTGAVSMGKYDFVGEALEKMGTRQVFHKVAIRPGKPLLFAELQDGPAFFGVPGNPVSTSVGIRFFLAPYLRAVMGLAPEKAVLARLSKASKKPEGLRCFFKARTELTTEGLRVEALAGQASFMVSPLLKANAWVVLDESGRQAEAGSEATVYPLFPDESGLLAERHGGHSFNEKGCC